MERTNAGRVADPMIGRVLDDRYRVGPKVARGGMATVYQATDLRLDRTVAIKIMHAGLGDDPDFVSRFEREARSAARLSHHNAVSVFDQGEDGETLFLVMEYVPGLTLRDLIRKEAPMPPGKALAVIEPVLAALAAAHGAGMIHRDVKPENVLLADDGRVKVADFGLARAVNAETQHTATGGVLIGTVSYLSPELVVDGKADARSDVYAAGVILYEMLTGQKPHQADSPIQVAYKHVHEDVPPPSRLVPGLPAYVDALVARATARDKDQRPADARVLLAHVHRVRIAVDQGIREDAELTADLMPRPTGTPVSNTHELPGRDEVFDQALLESHEARFAGEGLESVGPAIATGIALAEVEPTTVVPPPRRASPPAGAELQSTPPPGVAPPPGSSRPLPGRRRSRRGLYLLIGTLLLALLVGLGGWYLGVARYTVTPGVLNLPEAAAQAKVAKAGLRFATGEPAYSETVAKGSVIKTDPVAGSRVAKDGKVTAVLSLGPERYAVPRLRGASLSEASTRLRDAHLSLGNVVSQYHEKVPPDQVIGTKPAKGTQLKRDSAVEVVVSKGPKPIAIPDWTNRSADKAEQQLKKLGFKVDKRSANSDTVRAGRVISQTPHSGEGHKNDVISLVVSKGPELVEIPGIRGKRLDDASEQLKKLGLNVEVKKTMLYVGADIVVSSDPGSGTSVPKGSTVVLSIV